MKEPQYGFAVIGGDMRQVYLATELSRQHNRVCHYALIAEPDSSCHSSISCTAVASLKEACANSRSIVCPIPLSKNGCHINENTLDCPVSLDTLLSFLHPGHYFFAGCLPKGFQKRAAQRGVCSCDLMQEEALAVYNTIATAEGAICEAISKSPQNLHQSQCAVLGYGRCGLTLTQYLNRMFCHVHVYSNEKKECIQASLAAEHTGALCDFEHSAEQFDFIFNTIPAPVITSRILARMKPFVTVIDIASAPGGVDYAEAERLGINASLCPGLPGRYAPSSSAKAIMATMEAFLSQERTQ